jgi:hypothetical protein
MSDRPAFTSHVPFDQDSHLDGLFVVCSDGRFERHVNEFREHLQTSLGLHKLDRYFVPGSQLHFVTGQVGYPDIGQATDFWARFFIDNHLLKHVVIVGHEMCAAYSNAPAFKNFGLDELRQRQYADLCTRRDKILQHYPKLGVHTYYMKPAEDQAAVDFFPVS